MNKKRIWLIIPTTLIPYLVLFSLATIFASTKLSFFQSMMEIVFRENIINLVIMLLLYCTFSTVLSIICFVVSIRQKWNALSLAKTTVIVKLIQLPAYIFIFVLGFLLIISLFTIPFSIGLFLLDCLTVFLTGLLTFAAVINAVRQDLFKLKEVTWVIILQLIFCADVVASIVFYLKLKEKCLKLSS